SLFFFSSRRRHTRCYRDWSSDVCSSDLTQNTAYFRHVYDGEHADMRRLYEQAKLDQWNAATDIDWDRPLDSDGGLIADDLVDIQIGRASCRERGRIMERRDLADDNEAEQ